MSKTNKRKDLIVFSSKEPRPCPKCKKETTTPHDDWKDCLNAIKSDIIVFSSSTEVA